MRATAFHCSLVALILLFGPALLAKEKAAPAPPTVANLVVGDGYSLRVERHGVRKQFKGELVKMTDRWIVLRSTSIVYVEPAKSAGLPIVGTMFQVPHKERRDEFLWIPRDAAIAIEKQTHATKPPNVRIPDANSPPTKLACAVDLAVHDKLVQRAGGVQAVTDDHVTLSVTSKEPFEMPINPASFLITAAERDRPHLRFTREKLPRQEILCIHVPDLEAALRAAMSH
jgi:hypothetical protein